MPSPELDISSSHDNPISPGSVPTLTCTITLDPSIDRDVQISVSWNGPVYGFGEFTVTSQLFKSSAQVPTYSSTATLNADGTFYDSGQYNCSAVISSLSNKNLFKNASVTSDNISGNFTHQHYGVTLKILIFAKKAIRIGICWSNEITILSFLCSQIPVSPSTKPS